MVYASGMIWELVEEPGQHAKWAFEHDVCRTRGHADLSDALCWIWASQRSGLPFGAASVIETYNKHRGDYENVNGTRRENREVGQPV